MAPFVYRFRLKIPVLVSQLEVEVGVSLSISDHSGGGIVDIECDDSRAQDLTDSMVERGYEFVEGSPSTTADEKFMADNSIVGIGEHKALRQLIHFVDTNSPGAGFGDGPMVSEVSGGTFPTSETWYETAAKTKKVCRWEGTYNPNKTFATEKWIVYQDDGATPAADATDTISYSGVSETGRSRVIVEH